MSDYGSNIVAIGIAMSGLAELGAHMGGPAKHEREVARLFAEIKDNAVIGAALASQRASELEAVDHQREALRRSLVISGTQGAACQTD